MKKNKRNYNCYKGTLHTFGDNGSTIYHKRIYYRLTHDKEGNQRAKEILTGKEFPTCYSIILSREYSNLENFVSGNTEVYDYEVVKYLSAILSDERIFKKEVAEILLPKEQIELENNPKKRIKM